jgi:hypothetical protein
VTKQDDLSAEHISWLVDSRARNQEISLKLFLVMKDNDRVLRSNVNIYDLAQGLVSVNFSLWRAVFLTDVTSKLNSHVEDTTAFLGNLILHNMVAYPQDRNSREWTFMYYLNNARYRLESISRTSPDILPEAFLSPLKNATSKDRWTYFHTASTVALGNIEKSLIKLRKDPKAVSKKAK